MMPRMVYLMVMVKSIMPVKATMVLSNFLGAGDMMASFTGRKWFKEDHSISSSWKQSMVEVQEIQASKRARRWPFFFQQANY